MTLERIELRHGLVALVECSDDERPAYQPPKAETPPRRDPRNSHLWESCGCVECRDRRVREGVGR